MLFDIDRFCCFGIISIGFYWYNNFQYVILIVCINFIFYSCFWQGKIVVELGIIMFMVGVGVIVVCVVMSCFYIQIFFIYGDIEVRFFKVWCCYFDQVFFFIVILDIDGRYGEVFVIDWVFYVFFCLMVQELVGVVCVIVVW